MSTREETRQAIAQRARKRLAADLTALLERVRVTGERMDASYDAYHSAAAEHREAVRTAVSEGCRVSEVARLKGVSRQRIRTIIHFDDE